MKEREQNAGSSGMQSLGKGAKWWKYLFCNNNYIIIL